MPVTSTYFPLLSVVSPVYQAAKVLPELIYRLEVVLASLTNSYEIILVDDGSSDASWEAIELQATNNPHIRGVRLSRNFGQHHAITAGLDISQGEWIVVMDCDLQDQPEEIERLYAKAQEGYEVVLASRQSRQDAWFKKRLSTFFYRVLAYLSEVPQDSSIANFGIYHRRVIDVLTSMRESVRYFPTQVRWIGFRQTTLPVTHKVAGRASTYSITRQLRLALDILLSQSDKPLRLTVLTGLLLAAGAFMFGAATLLRYALGYIIVPGYASILVCITFFSGLIISVLGIVGLYVGKTFDGVRNRPLYVIAATTSVNSIPKHSV